MLKQLLSGFVACALLLGVGVVAAEKGAIKLDGIKCIMAPSKAANAEKSVSFKKGEVFFCCDGCKGKFEKDTEKFATKAHHQLVATKQYTQKACPLSGGDVNPEKTVKIGDVEVAFCCGNCQGKVAEAEGDAQTELVFNTKSFEKAFELTKKEEK
jgi:YHS domain-containing protein